MKAIQTTAMVGADHKLTVQLPPDIRPGPHQIVVVIEGQTRSDLQTWTMENWPIHDAALADPNFTMRREELYGDNGR